ncbi:hypothetical protein BD410DRAFT_796820 [Rickenella mellea]|uniref:Uncharacterized protein n=1 Tax=Rickenella mellea TaxID=50990 RepID=A0A4Y7PHU7_9AGAM|nr:hypothetical protein BD410DRAFT_796820 [Rickenella mellea]
MSSKFSPWCHAVADVLMISMWSVYHRPFTTPAPRLYVSRKGKRTLTVTIKFVNPPRPRPPPAHEVADSSVHHDVPWGPAFQGFYTDLLEISSVIKIDKISISTLVLALVVSILWEVFHTVMHSSTEDEQHLPLIFQYITVCRPEHCVEWRKHDFILCRRL